MTQILVSTLALNLAHGVLHDLHVDGLYRCLLVRPGFSDVPRLPPSILQFLERWILLEAPFFSGWVVVNCLFGTFLSPLVDTVAFKNP